MSVQKSKSYTKCLEYSSHKITKHISDLICSIPFGWITILNYYFTTSPKVFKMSIKNQSSKSCFNHLRSYSRSVIK